MMDANECAEKRSEEMNSLIQECGLVDYCLLVDPYSEVETYARGRGKIDYTLVTPKIQMCVRYAHIAPYNEWILSDHRALIVDIDYQTLEKVNWCIGRERKEASTPTRQKKGGNSSRNVTFLAPG